MEFAPTTVPPPPAVARPILYGRLEGDRPPRTLRTRAVEADGQPVALEIPGSGATWSPDGSWIAYVADLRELRVMNRHGATRTLLKTDGTTEGLFPRPAWSGDGRSIAIIRLAHRPRGYFGHALTVVDVASGEARGRHVLSEDVIHLPRHFTPPDAFRWSPDGSRVLVSWESAAVVELATGRIEPVSRSAAVAEWTPRGDGVIYFEITGTELGRTPRPQRGLGGFFFKSPGAAPVKLVDGPALEAAGLRASGPMHGVMTLAPSGKRLAVALLNGARPATNAGSILRLYDVSAGNPPPLLQPSEEFTTDGRVAALDWSPDERALAVMSVHEREVTLQRLDLAADAWTSLASWPLMAALELEVFTQKMLSWSR
jgi:dipeptidyl aminopeptidase/acylaminoacyl peptidase